MIRIKQLFFTIIPVILAACDSGSEDSSEKFTVDTLTIKKHVQRLASDEFLGRKPFSEGETKTLAYLKEQFQLYGLEPGNDESYFQEVPLVELDPTVSEMTVDSKGSSFTLEPATEFVAVSERVEEELSLDQSELVFAGYGIVAPEYGWNDYEGLDVEGKTVVVLVNDPGFGSKDSTLFKGRTMTYYGRWTYKYEEAARQGAAGVLIVHETVPAGYPWLVVRNGWSGSSLYLDQSDGQYKPIAQGWLSRDAAIRIFEASEVDMKNFVEKARSRDFKPVSLGVNVSLQIAQEIKKDVSQNVIAMIPGTSRPEETILYTAHWDHLGVGAPVDGDSIYNGAYDNATGTATLLAIAKAFSEKERPDRSVVFLAVTAEEQGLLGSKYYAENPVFPVDKTVANINMDALTFFGKMKDLTIIGYGQSELEDLAATIAKEQGRYVMPDPTPQKGYFFRSDHFQFAKVGIPALYAHGTYESMEHGVEYIEELHENINTDRYHRPADEFNADEWRFGAMKQDAELFFELGWKLSNSDRWPEWKEGSEFKSIREN